MIRVLPVFDDLARFILDVFEDLGFVQLGHCQKKFWIVLENPSESSTTHEEQQNIQLIESITTKFSSLDIVIHYKLTNPLNATDYDNPYYEEIKEIEASKSVGFKILALKIFFENSAFRILYTARYDSMRRTLLRNPPTEFYLCIKIAFRQKLPDSVDFW